MPETSTARLLEVSDLAVHLPTRDGVVKAVDGISYTLNAGETLGIVGESGSGKSVSCLTVLGLINRDSAQISGRVIYDGSDLLEATESELRMVRGNEISMIFQDPFAGLHPLFSVGDQLVEAIRAHEDVKKRVARERVVELLHEVGIPQAAERFSSYPHEYSGGMQQRAMIAMALINNPRILIADEPTTALDVTVQAQILELIEKIKEELSIGVILVTHDLGVVRDVTQNVLVMYAGRIVEHGSTAAVFAEPKHPYTWGLMESIPLLEVETRDLRAIDGAPPSLIHLPTGCAFHPRCTQAFEGCDKARPELDQTEHHQAACHLARTDRDRIWQERRRRPADASR